ncbi:MAG: CDP-2,3-bis-(O-geranylgeranyl)-sn-glycerol synthase [Candidatus Bathyarchaeota archaeon]|nr:CDP-2,3-bis-(O-geranylgeranyl)-sn-glycerol synthase [Candidatus Bathyarchaeota archaeon]
METILELIIEALKFILPAYCANAIPVITGGGLPIDFGKKFSDGKPIFGKNKTFRGFFSGLIVGMAVGFVESAFFKYHIAFGLLSSLGALFGDLTGAFVKRRFGLAPGDLLPIVDQVDFIIGAILFSLPISLQTSSLQPSFWKLVITVLIITPPIHMLTNFVAYKLGLKNNPW